MLGFAFGTGLYAFLLVLLIRKRPARSAEWALLWSAAGAFAWYFCGTARDLYAVAANPPAGDSVARIFEFGRWFGLSLISSASLHIATVRARRFALLSYGLLPVGWLLLHA